MTDLEAVGQTTLDRSREALETAPATTSETREASGSRAQHAKGADAVSGGSCVSAKKTSTWTKARVLAVARRDVLAAAIVVLVPLFWVIDATYRASLATLGRDQGIFQYVAWAIDNGARDYRDVRDVNGPLIHLIHLVFLKLGGADEHRFRVLDLLITGLTFALTGACLAGISRSGPSRAPSPSKLARVAWATAAVVTLSAQYHLFGPWNQAQRESFCDWFLLPSVGLLLLEPLANVRRESLRLALAGALSAIACFGKPSFALFTMAQLATLALTQDSARAAKRASYTFIIGALLGALVPLAFLVVYGDPIAFVRVSLTDVPGYYRFMWARSAREVLGDAGAMTGAGMGLSASALLFALVATTYLPKRVVVLAAMPIAAIGNIVVQHKGFDYHFHPLLMFTTLAWVVIVIMLWERYRNVGRARAWGKLIALAAAAILALTTVTTLRDSPHMRDVWILAGGETSELRGGETYLRHYQTHDYFPFEMREAAAYLRSVVPEDGTIQAYGMDPYVLFHARRMSASPLICVYDLDPTAALAGGFGSVPTEAQASFIHGARYRNEHAMLGAVMKRPPEAFVFIDKSPLMDLEDAEDDFDKWCPETSEWMRPRYHRAEIFGHYRVWLRNDL